jgi:hypothetical protein
MVDCICETCNHAGEEMTRQQRKKQHKENRRAGISWNRLIGVPVPYSPLAMPVTWLKVKK